jgi:hypothetical protein
MAQKTFAKTPTTMVRSIPSLGVAAAFLATVADARTTVAVLEVGKGGVVRRTTANSKQASVHGVASFWNAAHDEVAGRNRRGSAQHPGMAVVPDLFSRADGGIAIGLSGGAVDLTSGGAMPRLADLLDAEAVGSFELSGSHSATLLKKAGAKAEDVVGSAADLASSLKAKASAAVDNRLEGLSIAVHDEAAAKAVDSAIAAAVQSLRKQSEESGKTLLLHLVVDEEQVPASHEAEDIPSNRRRLEDNVEDQNENNDDDNNDQNWNGNNYNQRQASDGYGEKTIFQIQYFNVVLWSAIGLTIVLVSAISLMINMPLMADTLLFGESAKVVGD